MSAVLSCKVCGGSEIDTDAGRGDAVCTNCGYVLEESIIVSEVTFEEDGHGCSQAVGQFVSAESRGGGGIASVSAGFHSGVAKESRELTLRSAQKKIREVAQQLRLNQHCTEVAFNFFKMALYKQLTKGRKHALTIAACVYMTCRIEGTPHLLIDFSDVVQMDVYALGRAYVQISRALYINIPAVDPCMYILRFAHKFGLGEKTHDVAMTALRLVQRMKRDWIHLGRRPSGLCGAALLIAGRLHGFSRSVQDVIGVVKVHETTLRKRLVEFGETPSSSLTLDEFMSVDLEEEHDPPSFKAARMKDRERLQKLLDEEVNNEFFQLQKKIEDELDKRKRKNNPMYFEGAGPSGSQGVHSIETTTASRFIMDSTLFTIDEIMGVSSESEGLSTPEFPLTTPVTIRPTPASESSHISRMLMPSAPVLSEESQGYDDTDTSTMDDGGTGLYEVAEYEDGRIDLNGIDDDEINSYLMNANEVKIKTKIWEDINSDYIQQQKLKQDQLEKDRLEGKVSPDKKSKSKKSGPGFSGRGSRNFQAKSANEAIKIMLQERKMSNKINYEVLRSLTSTSDDEKNKEEDEEEEDEEEEEHKEGTAEQSDRVTVIESGPVIPVIKRSASMSPVKRVKMPKLNVGVADKNKPDEDDNVVVETGPVQYAQADEDEEEEEDDDGGYSAHRLLSQFREVEHSDYY